MEDLNINKQKTFDNIENLRANFLNEYNKQKRFSLIILVIFVVLMIGSLVLMISMPKKIHYVFIGIVVLFLGTYILAKKIKIDREISIKKYVENYRSLVNDFIYSDIKLENLERQAFEKISQQDVESTGVFSDLKIVESNDVVKGKFNNNKYTFSNVASYNSENDLIFYGKLFTIDMSKNIQGKLICSLITKDGKGPNITGLTKTHLINDEFSCYTNLSKETINDLINQHVAECMKKSSLNDFIKDINYVFVDNKFYLLVSTRNDMIDVPLKDAFDVNVLLESKKIVDLFFEIVKGINL